MIDFIIGLLERGITVQASGRAPVTVVLGKEANAKVVLNHGIIDEFKASADRLVNPFLASEVERRIARVKAKRGKRLPPIDPQKIVAVLAKAGKPMDRHQIASRLKVRYQRLIRLMDSLVAKGLVKFAGENRYTVTR